MLSLLSVLSVLSLRSLLSLLHQRSSQWVCPCCAKLPMLTVPSMLSMLFLMLSNDPNAIARYRSLSHLETQISCLQFHVPVGKE